jgi:hypothetical protein
MTRSFRDTLREGSNFFMKRGGIYETLTKITERLREEKIDYVVIGAMALSAHGFRRFTKDVDLLTTPEGLDAIHQRLVGRGYALDARTEAGVRTDGRRSSQGPRRRPGIDQSRQAAARPRRAARPSAG